MDTSRLTELSEEVKRLCQKEQFRKKWKALTYSAFAKHALRWEDFEMSAAECTSILLEQKVPANSSLNELFSFLSFATAHTRFKGKVPETTKDIVGIWHNSTSQLNEPLISLNESENEDKIYRSTYVSGEIADLFDESFVEVSRIESELEKLFPLKQTAELPDNHFFDYIAKLHFNLFCIHPYRLNNWFMIWFIPSLLVNRHLNCPLFIPEGETKHYFKLMNLYSEANHKPLASFFAEITLFNCEQLLAKCGSSEIQHDDPAGSRLKLLKQRLERTSRTESEQLPERSRELQLKVLEESILPLANRLFERMAETDDFFEIKELNCTAEAIGKDVSVDRVIDELKEFFKQTKQRYFNINFHRSGLKNGSLDAFGFFISLQIELDHQHIYINRNNNELRTYCLNYDEKLSERQIEEITAEMLSQLLDYIDKHLDVSES